MLDVTQHIDKFEKRQGEKNIVDISATFKLNKPLCSPKISIIFECGDHFRRLPMNIDVKGDKIIASNSFDVPNLYYKTRLKNEVSTIKFAVQNGNESEIILQSELFVKHSEFKSQPIKQFLKSDTKEKKKKIVGFCLNSISIPFRALKIKDNRVLFLTNRADIPFGNSKAVLDKLSQNEKLDIKILCSKGGSREALKNIFNFLKLYMTSKVVFVDDYYHLISYISKKKDTTLIQLWHGCGAFKTFGFSRYHKDSSLQVDSPNHRQYDFAVVSSDNVCGYYAEAFGIRLNKVLPLGAPRCDILLSDEHKKEFSDSFYAEFPNAKDKKMLLFAPTFRGGGEGDCYYPTEKFNVDNLLSELGDEWCIAIKLHPYLKEKMTFSDGNASRVIECNHLDINDLLLVSDFLVTDYSSVIFEASLVGVPMAFLAFDLDEYIEKRDFYFDFKSFVPGEVAKTDLEIAKIAKNGNYNFDKLNEFKKRNFGEYNGNATEKVAEFALNILKK